MRLLALDLGDARKPVYEIVLDRGSKLPTLCARHGVAAANTTARIVAVRAINEIFRVFIVATDMPC